MTDKPMAAFVDGLDRNTGKTRTVPAHYINNPNIFGGAFVLPTDPAAAPKPQPKKTSRSSHAGSVETPAAPVAATDTNPAQAGDTDSEE